MTKFTSMPLDSYRLAQYVQSIPCYICEGPNHHDAELCRHCFAPMALAHQANCQKVKPSLIAAIGASNSGKTVYLGMLAELLSRNTGPIQLLARGAFSIGMQQATIAALARCEFPAKTPNDPDRWNWMHCQVIREQQPPLELIFPDLAGEALMAEVEHPGSFPMVRTFLSRCTALLVLIDSASAATGDCREDLSARKLLTYLSELDTSKSGWSSRPVAIVFSKADACDSDTSDPVRFANTYMGGLASEAAKRVPKHQFFAARVAGATAYRHSRYGGKVHVPIRVEPHGVTQPLEWLLGQITPPPRKGWFG